MRWFFFFKQKMLSGVLLVPLLKSMITWLDYHFCNIFLGDTYHVTIDTFTPL